MMKRLFLIASIICIASLYGFAQKDTLIPYKPLFKKGSFFISPSLWIKSERTRRAVYNLGKKNSEGAVEVNTYSAEVKGGYFLLNKWSIGLGQNANWIIRHKVETSFETSTIIFTGYFLPVFKRVLFTTEGFYYRGILNTTQVNTGLTKNGTYGYGMEGSLQLIISDNFTAGLTINYANETINYYGRFKNYNHQKTTLKFSVNWILAK